MTGPLPQRQQVSLVRRMWLGLKAAFTGGFPRTTMPWWSWTSPRSRIDYSAEVGDVLRSNLVTATVFWLARTFPEAPLFLQPRAKDASGVFTHPLLSLLERPNPYYSGLLLWAATIIDFTVTGNAYWLKVRSGSGRPVQLWYVPSFLIEPRWPDDGSAFLSHYEYSPNGMVQRIDTSEVIHFRYFTDPQNLRKGLSPLASLLREIYTDEEAAQFTAVLLKNHGVPGIVISPEGEDGMSKEDVVFNKEYLQENFTGDQRGMPLVASGPLKVQQYGYSPQQLDLGRIRTIPEERVTAVIGVPAAVVGLGTGLDQTKVGATMRELRELAYENTIIPTQRLLASELKVQLLPDFVANAAAWDVLFDLSKVRVLQEDQNKLAERWDTMVRGGWVTVAAAKKAIGLPVTDFDNIYLRNIQQVEVLADEDPRERAAADAAAAAAVPEPSVNGNGKTPAATDGA